MKRSWMNLRVMCVAAMLCATGCGPAGDAPKDQQQPMTKQAARQLARQQQQDPSGDADPNSGGDPATGQDVCAEQGWYGDGECDEFCDSPDPDCLSCRSDSQCAAAEVCVNHSCLPTSSCTADADCAIGLACGAGTCGIPALVADSDGDGIPNVQDNCPNTPNADQLDSNNDGVGDACSQSPVRTCSTSSDCSRCEVCIGGTCTTFDPTRNDVDSDGIPNASDNCIQTPNPDQADTDGDGVGDACDGPATYCRSDAECAPGDVCVDGACMVDPSGDVDGDGIPDASDNCPQTPNADQLDSDRDGVGDACDAQLTSCTAHADCAASEICHDNLCVPGSRQDTDGDAILDIQDNCPTTPNTDQADADGDGIGDACEDATPQGCRTDAECAVGQVCVNHMCATP